MHPSCAALWSYLIRNEPKECRKCHSQRSCCRTSSSPIFKLTLGMIVYILLFLKQLKNQAMASSYFKSSSTARTASRRPLVEPKKIFFRFRNGRKDKRERSCEGSCRKKDPREEGCTSWDKGEKGRSGGSCQLTHGEI